MTGLGRAGGIPRAQPHVHKRNQNQDRISLNMDQDQLLSRSSWKNSTDSEVSSSGKSIGAVEKKTNCLLVWTVPDKTTEDLGVPLPSEWKTIKRRKLRTMPSLSQTKPASKLAACSNSSSSQPCSPTEGDQQ